jgi:hypothetical protein
VAAGQPALQDVIWIDGCLSDTTMTPPYVAKPGIPVDAGRVRSSVAPLQTFRVWLNGSTTA